MLLNSLVSLALVQSAGDVHEHGKAVLSLTSDGTALIAEFTTDHHTLYGADHDDEGHRAAVDDKVRSELALFELETSVPCERLDSSIGEAAAAGLGEKDHEHDDHDHHHDDHEHDDHHHEDEHHDHDGHGEHIDMTVSVSFSCKAVPVVQSVTVRAFDTVPALEDVDIIVLTNTQQAEVSTSREQKKILLP